MNPVSGPLDGRVFTAEQPYIVIGWPSKSTVSAFQSKIELWNYLEAACRRDPNAIFAHAYEFADGNWSRIPTVPTYLARREIRFQMAA